MKAFILSLVTATIFFSSFITDNTDKILTTKVYQGNVIDQLDPSWPKLA